MTQTFNITLQISAENKKSETEIKKALIYGLENQETHPGNREPAASVEVEEQ